MESDVDNLEQARELARSNNERDWKRAFELLKTASASGSGEAAYALGTWYISGKLVTQDADKAISYWFVAEERGYTIASIELAKYWENGEFVEVNYPNTLYHYTKAALLGNGQAHYEIGRLFYYGLGVPENREIANLWFDRAEELEYFEEE